MSDMDSVNDLVAAPDEAADQDVVEGSVVPVSTDADAVSGTGDSAPGLVQGLNVQPGAGDAGPTNRRTPVRRRSVQDERTASELLQARDEVDRAGIRLTAAEERDIRNSTSSPEDAAEMREELLASRRQDAAMRQVRGRINPAVPVQQLASRPSFATTSASIEYHTREAFGFLLGRTRMVEVGQIVTSGEVGEQPDASEESGTPRTRRVHITGLFEAAHLARGVVQGHISGCPYATWYLVRIEDEIRSIREMVKRVNERADEMTRWATSLTVAPLTVRLPAKINLTFHVPYGYHFADLLTAYDNLIRKVKSYVLMNFISYAEFRSIERALGTPLRRLYRLPGEWSFVGRDAVLQKTARLLAAEHQMGILPEEILLGELKPAMVRSD